MQATKMLAEAKQADEAASGLAAAQVKEAGAVALEKEGTAEATVLRLKFSSEATGIEEKAAAMKLFHDAGKEHEEFKLQLNKDKDIEIAAIDAQRNIAEAQAEIVGEALKTAHIDIVGGETEFFDKYEFELPPESDIPVDPATPKEAKKERSLAVLLDEENVKLTRNHHSVIVGFSNVQNTNNCK